MAGRGIAGTGSYRDEPGGLRGAPDLAADYEAVTGRTPSLPPVSETAALKRVA